MNRNGTADRKVPPPQRLSVIRRLGLVREGFVQQCHPPYPLDQMARDAGCEFPGRLFSLVPIVDVDADLQQIGAVEFRPHMGHKCVSQALSAQAELGFQSIRSGDQFAAESRRRGGTRNRCRSLRRGTHARYHTG